MTSDFAEMKPTKTATVYPGMTDEPSNPVTGGGTVAVMFIYIAFPVLALTVEKAKKRYKPSSAVAPYGNHIA